MKQYNKYDVLVVQDGRVAEVIGQPMPKAEAEATQALVILDRSYALSAAGGFVTIQETGHAKVGDWIKRRAPLRTPVFCQNNQHSNMVIHPT